MRGFGHVFIVWGKAATIRFRRSGRSTLYATFRMLAAEVETVRQEALGRGRAERSYFVELVDAEGRVHAECEKLIRIHRK